MTSNVHAGKVSAGTIARIGVLGAIAALLFMLEFPVLGFYKLDLSTLPVLLGGFAMGPWAGLAIALIKALTGFLHTTTGGVGEFADFLCTGSFVLVASMMYKHDRTFKGALKGMALGIGVMTLVGAAANYYILLPLFAQTMSMDVIIGIIAAIIPAVDSVPKLILMATVPFNIFKGVVLCVLTLLLYKHLSPLLHGRR